MTWISMSLAKSSAALLPLRGTQQCSQLSRGQRAAAAKQALCVRAELAAPAALWMMAMRVATPMTMADWGLWPLSTWQALPSLHWHLCLGSAQRAQERAHKPQFSRQAPLLQLAACLMCLKTKALLPRKLLAHKAHQRASSQKRKELVEARPAVKEPKRNRGSKAAERNHRSGGPCAKNGVSKDCACNKRKRRCARVTKDDA